MTKKVEKRVPDIRFKGFTDDWEQRELKQLGNFNKGKGYSKKDIQPSGKPLFLYGRLYTEYSEKTESVQTFTNIHSNSVISHGDEVVLPDSGETAIDIARATWISNKGIILGGGLLIVHPFLETLNPGFLAYILSYGNNHKQLASKAQGKSIVHIHLADLENLSLIFPAALNEQEKILNLLNKLNVILDLQQKKLEQLRLLKKAMLQQIFTDTAQPQSRFKGFNDNWEQRKFGDLVDRKSKQTKSTADIPSVEYDDIISGQGKLNKNVSTKEVMKNGIKFDDTNVLYGKLRPYLHNWLNASFTGVAVGDWWVFKPVKISKNYLYYLIQTKKYDNVANLSSGSKMPRSDWNLVSNTLFGIPNTKEEQKKIGVFLSDLDSLIALHQRKLNNFKQIKKFLLQNLFI